MYDFFDYVEPYDMLAQQAVLSVLQSNDDDRIDDICGKAECESPFALAGYFIAQKRK